MSSVKRLVSLHAAELASDPLSPRTGDVYFNTVSKVLRFYNGTQWVNLSGAAGSLVNIDSISTPDFIEFDTTPELTSNAVGAMQWNEGDSTLDIKLDENTTLHVGQQQYSLVYNATGTTLTKGTVVYVNGSQGNRPRVARSNANNEITSSKTFGVVAENITSGNEGYVLVSGILKGINTTSLTEGAPLWLSTTDGLYTMTKPTQPNHLVFIGYVIRNHQSAGEIYVKIQNGYELNEIHDVLITNPADKDFLVYESSTGLWKNTQAQEQIQDLVSSLLNHNSHTNLTVTYDDTANKLILEAQSGGSAGTDSSRLVNSWWLGA